MDVKEAAKAWANGESLQYELTSGNWYDYQPVSGKDVVFLSCNEYRIKPHTIRIGEYEVPEPVREPLKDGEAYYTEAQADPSLAHVSFWDGGLIDMHRLESGLIHRTEKAAKLCAEAKISLTRKGS